jgi:uncharacterized protein (DUF1778 family)
MSTQATRTQRIEARITPDGLAMVKRAAEIEGRSISDFLVASAQAAAKQVIEDNHVIRLTLEDQRAFIEALIDPPEPTPALKRAFERYDQVTGGK